MGTLGGVWGLHLFQFDQVLMNLYDKLTAPNTIQWGTIDNIIDKKHLQV